MVWSSATTTATAPSGSRWSTRRVLAAVGIPVWKAAIVRGPTPVTRTQFVYLR